MEVDIIKQANMEGKIKKEYLRWTRKLLETKLYGRNLQRDKLLDNGKYSESFFKCTKEEFK